MVFKISVRKRLDADVRRIYQRAVADSCTCNGWCAAISLPFCERDIWGHPQRNRTHRRSTWTHFTGNTRYGVNVVQ